jgi:hypothetical protein
MATPNDFYLTALGPTDYETESKRAQFVVKQMLKKLRTTMPVQIMAVTNSGGVSPIGYVDINPLVSQLDGNGVIIPHGVIHNVPYLRISGGANAIILDPQVGDIGFASFCDRDISSVKASKSASGPASLRRHDMSDAIYHSTIISRVAPTQYVQFSAAGINITSPVAVTVTAPIVNVVASTSASVTSPIINLGAMGQTLMGFINSAFVSLFNGHTHATGGSGVPNTPIDSTMVSTTVKGG